MKYILLMLFNFAYALPILDQSAGSGHLVFVYPDHENVNLFYATPTSVEIAKDNVTNTPLFSYQEYRNHCSKIRLKKCHSRAIIRVLLKPKFEKLSLDKIRKNLLEISNDPVITSLPFIESELNLEKSFREINHDLTFCNHRAGQAGSYQACVIHLTETGVKLKRKFLTKAMTLMVHFDFKVRGVLSNLDKSFNISQKSFGVGGSLGGSILKYYPHLFKDADGNIIKDL